MTELRELFEDATEAPPPTRLLADQVYAAGRRRRRRRAAAMAGTAFAVTACAVATAAVVAMPGTGSGPAPVDDQVASAAPTGAPGVLPHPGRIQWMRAADSRHLYLALSTCSGGPCKTIWQLVGSDDGGRTWTERGTPAQYANALVLGPDLLLVDRTTEPLGGRPSTLVASRDGGRSWQATGTAPAVPAVAPGSFAVCRPDPETESGGTSIPGVEPCQVYAFDPVTNRVSPLTEQPAQILGDRQAIVESDGRLWAPGYDRESARPAIATSVDGGRSWSSHTFAEMAVCGAYECPQVQISIGPGGVDYAVVTDTRGRAVYRHTVAEGWQRRPGADQVPYEPSNPGSFVTPDGSHVVYQASTGPRGPGSGEYRFWAARRGGASYQQVELRGLPPMFSPVLRARDGWLYARGDGDVSYGSADGWTWVPLNRR
ncbi:hypothetical protein GCM10022225_44140 [Plantactinospora mayteni]|uniref:Exo-alpha-sialidase n=1 Tax=Plantactinospora mayteni TaxID=566021 RepID=A0ABQ4ERV0_9ACTN|nr:sialidase family protein [Plantactinospora mayteni]GIG97376.1 hypothetical protein Pma05_39490 [Plantactinospora mayteni]